MVCTYNGIPLSYKKEWNNTICSNTVGPRDYHTKWSKSDRERQMPYDITYMWNLKYDTNEPIYETETDSQRKDVWLPKVRRGGGRMHWEFGVSRCKLFYIGCINNKVLLDSTGNYIQYPVIGASLVAQWLRICLPMQGTWVRALVQEDPTCHGATKPVRRNYWACALEPVSHNYWARVPQLLKPVCLEPVLRNKRSHHNKKTMHRNKE